MAARKKFLQFRKQMIMKVYNIVNEWNIEMISASKYNDSVIQWNESQPSKRQDIMFTGIAFS